MSTDSATDKPKEAVPPVPWVEFLQEHPPGKVVLVTGAYALSQGLVRPQLNSPQIHLFCPEDTCNGYMFFTSTSDRPYLAENEWKFNYLTYYCRNCQRYWKTFSLAVMRTDNQMAEAFKFGELPNFGPPVPPRVLRLIQPDRELFLCGRRCENQSLGIGAFAYYRRVVENQWTRLVDEIIKVAKAIKAPEPTIAALHSVRSEQQFSKAVKSLKDAIPPALLINGHNPLVLLHSALSQGVHDLSDDECLTLATSIRVILFEFAEKLGQALKDEKELTDAVSRLLQAKAKKDVKAEEANASDAGEDK
jgi:hypothetical protein